MHSPGPLAARKPLHVCFDLDGTLFESGESLDHEDPQSYLKHTRPIYPALRRLERLFDAGATVSFVTGRQRKCEWATNRQLRMAFGDRGVRGVDIFHRDDGPYDLMSCLVYKLDVLRFLKPDFYVGDLPMDQTASAAAGVRFFPAEWWAKGHELLVGDDFEPRSLQLRLGVVDDARRAAQPDSFEEPPAWVPR